jgi:hypothetical protein
MMSINTGQSRITNYLQAAASSPKEPKEGTPETHSASSQAQAAAKTSIQQMPIKKRRIVIDDDDCPETVSTANAGGQALDGSAVLIVNAEVEITHETPAPAAAASATQKSDSKQKHRRGKVHRDSTVKRRSRLRRPPPSPPSSVRHPKFALLILHE